jgi:hypothetical protein
MNVAAVAAGGLLHPPKTGPLGRCSLPATFGPLDMNRRRHHGFAEEIGRDDRESRVSCDFPEP